MNEHDLMQALERRAGGVEPGAAPLAAMTGRAATIRRRRSILTAVAAAAAVAVVATTASLVGLGDETSAPEVVSPGGVPGTLGEALSVLPAEMRSVSFNDREAAASRLGLDQSSVASYVSSIGDYLDATSGRGDEDPGGLLGPASVYLTPMQDLPFNDFETVWSAVADRSSGGIGEGGATVYQVSPDTDLDALADDLLVAGLEEGELLGRRYFFAETPSEVADSRGTIGEGYPIEFVRVTIDPDADLVITGPAGQAVLEVLDGDRDSLDDAGTFTRLVTGSTRVERARLSSGSACLGKSVGVGEVESSGYLVTGRPDASVGLAARVELADEESAAQDLAARTTYFEQGSLGEEGVPLDEYGSYEVARQGRVVDIELGEMSAETHNDLTREPGSIVGC